MIKQNANKSKTIFKNNYLLYSINKKLNNFRKIFDQIRNYILSFIII